MEEPAFALLRVWPVVACDFVCPVHLFLSAACHGVYPSTALSRSCEVDEDAVFWTDELIGCLAVELRSITIVTGVELRLGFPGRDSIQSYFGHLCQELTSGWDRTRLRTLLIGDFYGVVAFASEPVACVSCTLHYRVFRLSRRFCFVLFRQQQQQQQQ